MSVSKLASGEIRDFMSLERARDRSRAERGGQGMRQLRTTASKPEPPPSNAAGRPPRLPGGAIVSHRGFRFGASDEVATSDLVDVDLTEVVSALQAHLRELSFSERMRLVIADRVLEAPSSFSVVVRGRLGPVDTGPGAGEGTSSFQSEARSYGRGTTLPLNEAPRYAAVAATKSLLIGSASIEGLSALQWSIHRAQNSAKDTFRSIQGGSFPRTAEALRRKREARLQG